MQNLHRLLLSSRLSASSLINKTLTLQNQPSSFLGVLSSRTFSDRSNRNNPNDGWEQGWDNLHKQDPTPSSSDSSFSGWDSVSSWSTGLTDQHFDGQAVGRQVISGAEGLTSGNEGGGDNDPEYRRCKAYVDSWDDRMQDMSVLMKQVREPGARGSYLKDSEKAEMYRLHKENPELYTVEKLAKDYRIMRQRVHAILWLKELEEEEEKKLGHPLDDSIEVLLDTCPEFFESHCKEFHVASLPYKPDFKVMPEGWDGTTRDPDEVLYEISKKEDEMLYQEFVQRMNFNKKKMAGEIKCHKYSRRRSSEGWKITVEKLGPHGKRGGGGGWKFVSLPDGSSRTLNEVEKMFVRRETPKRRRKIFP